MVVMRLIITLLFIYVHHLGFPQIDYNAFQGKQSSISYSKVYSFANFYDYQPDASGKDSIIIESYGSVIPEEGLVLKYQDNFQKNKKDTIVFGIILKTRLKIEVNNVMHVFIKYKLLNNNIVSEDYELVDLIKTDDMWIENQRSDQELESLQNLLRFINADLMFKFFGESDNPNYPIVNELKSLVKNEKGILDIRKMENVLKQNRDRLNIIDGN